MERPWWAPIPVYLCLPLTVIFLVVCGASWVTYQACSGHDSSFCLSVQLRPLAHGTYGGLLFVVGALMVAALVAVVVAPILLRRSMVASWVVAGVGFALAILAFLVMSGSLGTPWGALGQPPPPPPVSVGVLLPLLAISPAVT